jgi:hypothetical protein
MVVFPERSQRFPTLGSMQNFTDICSVDPEILIMVSLARRTLPKQSPARLGADGGSKERCSAKTAPHNDRMRIAVVDIIFLTN